MCSLLTRRQKNKITWGKRKVGFADGRAKYVCRNAPCINETFEECMSKLKSWVNDCNGNHDLCGPFSELSTAINMKFLVSLIAALRISSAMAAPVKARDVKVGALSTILATMNSTIIQNEVIVSMSLPLSPYLLTDT